MRKLCSGAVLVALVSAAVGCSGDRTLAPAGPGVEAVTVAPSCDFKTIKSLVISDFASQQQTTVQNILKQMQAAYGTSNKAAATPFGFKIMNELAKGVKAGTLVGTPQVSSDLTAGLIGCMQVTVSDQAGLGFAPAFQRFGAFEVRGLLGASGTELAVFSRDGAYSALSGPPAVGGSDFFGWLGGTALIYGWPRSESEFRTEDPLGRAYNWFSVRAGTNRPTANGLVAICATDLASGRFRVQHGPAITLLQDPSVIDGWSSLPACETVQPTLASATNRPLIWLADALRSGAGLLAPEPLHAATLAARTGGGGSTGSFSPFGGVDAGAVKLVDTTGAAAFFNSPRDGKIGALSPAVVIKAVGDGGTPLPGVSVTIAVSGNSGSFKVCSSSRGPAQLTQVTDSAGHAAFDIAIDKPGGYTLSASTSFSGYSVTSVTSPLFNLQNGPFTCP
jgi:hypothetical protein